MSKALKVGLIGTGMIAWSHLSAYKQYSDKVRLSAICDIREDALRKFADEANVNALYTDYRKMLRDADIDAVTICTSHDQHEPQTIAAAAAGKHVLLEKPMGRNMQECRNMVSAAEKAGVTFMVGQDLRFLPHTLGIKRLVENGELGDIRITRCNLIVNWPGGFGIGHWLSDGKIAGGGILISGLIHQIDLMRYYIGDIKSVNGICQTIQPDYINNAEDYVCATLEFECGAIGDVLGIAASTRASEGLHYTLYGDEGTIVVTSENARSRVEQFGQGKVASSTRDKDVSGPEEVFGRFVPVEPVYDGLASDDPFINEILHFADCCETGAEPITSGRDNLGTIKTIFGIYESSLTGSKIELSNI